MLVSRWCYQSGSLKVISQFSLNGIGCKTRKVCHRSLVGLDPSIVSQIGLLQVCLTVSFSLGINRLQGAGTCC